jgi:hypothetical protein
VSGEDKRKDLVDTGFAENLFLIMLPTPAPERVTDTLIFHKSPSALSGRPPGIGPSNSETSFPRGGLKFQVIAAIVLNLRAAAYGTGLEMIYMVFNRIMNFKTLRTGFLSGPFFVTSSPP